LGDLAVIADSAGSADLALGIDLGTSGVAVVALGADGAVVARAASPLPLATPRPGWTQQNPSDWIAAAESSLRQVAAQLGGRHVAAIGLTGQMHGMVAVDAADEVVTPAILWNDGRTTEQVAHIERVVGSAAVIRRTGNLPVPGFQLPKVLWLREHEPEAFARTRHVLFPKDYLGLHLSGRRYAEPTDASGSGCFELETSSWDTSTLGALDLDPGLWPEIVASEAIVGELDARLAARFGLRAGIPVVAGAGDNAAAAAAQGLTANSAATGGGTAPSLGSVSLGTSGVVQVPVVAPQPDPKGRVHLFADAFGDYLLLGVTLSAAGSLRWFRDTLAAGRSYHQLLALAASSPAGANGVTFVPYLAGERTPHMRADLRGSLQGLSLATTEGDIVRAVVEGVAFSLRDALDVMRPLVRSSQAGPSRFLATGGGAASDLWLETIATLFRSEVARPLDGDGTAYEVGAAEGAALLAWRGLGVKVALTAPGEQVFTPVAAHADALEDAYRRYLDLSRRD